MRFIHILVCLFTLVVFAEASNEGCIQCHTDESILQMLVNPPKLERVLGVNPAGEMPPSKTDAYFRRYLVDRSILNKDPHFENGCVFCHKGDAKSIDQESAHKGVVKRPSADLKLCGNCHDDIAKIYSSSLHYNLAGFLDKITKRFSKDEDRLFKDKVFGQSCKSCHASCGDCHVSSPSVKGMRRGFIDGHRFVKKDESKTCAVCHGGRIYPEYIGKLSGTPDIHFQKGMGCTDCHKKGQMHGSGNSYTNKDEAKDRPRCKDCHKTGGEAKVISRLAHSKHEGKVSCYGCHVHAAYSNCYDCHDGNASSSKPSFILGVNPIDRKSLTTLRALPIERNTFAKYGIKMEKFDEIPDYRAAPVHNIRKSTDRTRSCDICHINKKDFLTRGSLLKNGSRANEKLIFNMAPLDIN